MRLFDTGKRRQEVGYDAELGQMGEKIKVRTATLVDTANIAR